MPDKTQNININYRVNTTEVKAAEATLQRAQAANDRFGQSAQAVGTKLNQSYKGVGLSIETLRGKVLLLKEQIEKASDPKVVRRLSDEYKKLKVELDKAVKSALGMADAQKKVADSTKSAASAFKDLYEGAKVFIAAQLLREVISTALEMAKLAGNIEGVSRAFNRLPNATLVLDSLKRATHGTVGDLELMQKALQAANFKIPLEQLGVLFEFAATKAQQTGQEVNHLVDYIVSGIGYRSIKRLDDLGFTANRVKAALGGVSLQAATTGQVMNAVTTLMNEDLQKTGGYTETAATKVEQLGVEWRKLKEEVATSTSKDGGLVDLLKEAVEGARLLYKLRTQGNRGIIMEGITAESIKLAREFTEAIAGRDLPSRIEDTQQEMNSLQQTIGRYNDMIAESQKIMDRFNGFGLPGFSKENEEGAKRFAELQKQYGKNADDIFEREFNNANKQRNSLIANKKVLEETIVILKQYFATLEAPPEVIESLGLIEAKLQEIEEAGDRLKTAKTTGEIHSINNELSKLNGELADLKAFGTTKQFLEVEGKLKLVPVVDPKGVKDILEQEPIFRDGVTVPLTVDGKIVFDFAPDRSGADSGAGSGLGSLNEQIEKQIQEAVKNIPPINLNVPVEITPMTAGEKIGQEFAENWQSILGQGLEDTAEFFGSVVQAEADQYDARLKQSQDYYDRLMILAGDNENAKDRLRMKAAQQENKLRREAFEADKKAKRSQAVINGATGIINAFATLPYPAAIVASAFIAAATIKQLAVIDQQKARFAKGGLNIQGPGTGTSDSINAKISKGESVMTAEETRKSFGILKAVRAKRLDDRILENLKLSNGGVQVVNGMSDKRLLKKLDELKNSMPDYVQQGGVLWKTKVKSDTYRRWVRAKTI